MNMRKNFAIYVYAFAQVIDTAWYGFNKYLVANLLTSVFIGMNIMTIRILFSGKKYWRQSIGFSISDLIILILIAITVSVIFNKTYMESLQFEKTKLRTARLILFIYYGLSVIAFIAAKESLP